MRAIPIKDCLDCPHDYLFCEKMLPGLVPGPDCKFPYLPKMWDTGKQGDWDRYISDCSMFVEKLRNP
jgi:hypothetical protein